ncbi:MAG: TusE/DsrC/DsvC family sulfur relay protein [Nitrososphaerota archaeon]|nr:TusE/DsrC/DsvC family sulfur relay protein [Nitrososphaerota archaeon]
MQTIEFKGMKLIVDEDGFLQEPEKWSREVAEFFAKHFEGIEQMTEEHWKVVNYLREYYLKYGIAPPIRMLVKQTGFSLAKIYELFPSGPAKGACKVAGLPKPTGCV